jgi:hypothetical protein
MSDPTQVDVYRDGKPTSLAEAGVVLRTWSARLRLGFEAANIHITAGHNSGGDQGKLVAAMQTLGHQLDLLSRGIFNTMAQAQDQASILLLIVLLTPFNHFYSGY